MKTKWLVIITVISLICAAAFPQEPKRTVLSSSDEAAIQKLVKVIQAWGKDPVLVKEVVAQNSRKMTAAEVQTIDKTWMAGGETERSTRIMTNSCANRLKELVASNAAFSESFVMDNQGANVCMTNRTSDFWQGDEAKWQKSFNNGTGATFVDSPKYDASAKAILLQVSVPVMQGSTAIGAITVGVNTKNLSK